MDIIVSHYLHQVIDCDVQLLPLAEAEGLRHQDGMLGLILKITAFHEVVKVIETQAPLSVIRHVLVRH